jgi:hypothetical protein
MNAQRGTTANEINGHDAEGRKGGSEHARGPARVVNGANGTTHWGVGKASS